MMHRNSYLQSRISKVCATLHNRLFVFKNWHGGAYLFIIINALPDRYGFRAQEQASDF
jgi:hypothetical protein